MRSLYLVAVYIVFFVLGVQAPFVLTLGYVWVDTFRPNLVSYSLLSEIPASLIIALGAIGSYAMLDRKSPPKLNLGIAFTLLFAGWITLTTSWALFPDSAWGKWDWAFKTIMFSAFVPFVFRSKNQIEAYLLVYAFSYAAHFIPFGIKTIISGGRYGANLGLISGNSSIAESSTLAAVSASLIPIFLFLKNHGQLIPRSKTVNAMYWTLIVLAVSSTIGTYARTGLIGLAVVAFFVWVQSRHKILIGIASAIALLVSLQFVADDWVGRMTTIGEYEQDSSALGRVMVWEWTLEFVRTHPAGGGFNSYLANSFLMPTNSADWSQVEVSGKAFHSIYFEVLGEHGYFGLFIFVALAMTSIAYLVGATRSSTHLHELKWARALAIQLLISLLTLMVCGAFIGIAFQPALYYIFSASMCLHEYIRRVRSVHAGATCMKDTDYKVIPKRTPLKQETPHPTYSSTIK